MIRTGDFAPVGNEYLVSVYAHVEYSRFLVWF